MMAGKEKTVETWQGSDGLTMDSKIQPTDLLYPQLLKKSTIGNDGGELPDRFRTALEFEREVWNWIENCQNIKTATPTGFEHCLPDRTFREILRNCNSPLADQYRYAPDFLAVTNSGKLFYIECKASLHIERDCYEHYIALDAITPTWLIVLGDNAAAYWQRVSSIQFVDSLVHVAGFPVPFPVDPDGWITPRSGSGHSSCPYRVVDLASMEPLDLGGTQ